MARDKQEVPRCGETTVASRPTAITEETEVKGRIMDNSLEGRIERLKERLEEIELRMDKLEDRLLALEHRNFIEGS
jgi:hypothetical protein